MSVTVHNIMKGEERGRGGQRVSVSVQPNAIILWAVRACFLSHIHK